MITATTKDRNTVVDILTHAFYGNRSVNYVIKQDSNKKQRIRGLMEYSFDVCMLFGKVFLSDDRKGCALILFPEKKKTTLKAMALDIKLVLTCLGIGNLLKTINRENKVKSFHPDSPFVHLWFIGVDPLSQNRGIGGKLLQEVINEADSMQRPVYLETSTLKNIPWYEKFKFKIYNHIDLGYKLFLLANHP